MGVLFNFEKKSKIKAGEGLEKGKYKFFTSSPIQSKFLDEYLFDKESIIFGTGGQPSIHYCNEKFSTSTDCFVITPKSKNILPKYAYYFLLNNMDILERGFKGAGLKHISKKYLQNIDIIFPDNLLDQKDVITKLTKLENILNYKETSIQLMDSYIRSVFYNIFGDPINNSKNWDMKNMSDFGLIQTGNTPSRKNIDNYGNYIEWIKSDNINTPSTYLTKSEEYLSEIGYKKGRIVPEGSILVTCIAGSISCLGNVAVANREVAFNQQINSITPNENCNVLFLYHLILNTKLYLQSFSKSALKGMINKKTFSNIPMIHPPIHLQNQFGEIVQQIEEIKEYQLESKKELENLFNNFMQKSVGGI